MVAQGLVLGLLAFCATGVHAMAGSTGLTKGAGSDDTSPEVSDQLAAGVGMVLGGVNTLIAQDFYTGSSLASVNEIVLNLQNITLNVIEELSGDSRDLLDKEVEAASDAVKGKDKKYSTLDGIRRIGAGSDMITNATLEIGNDQSLFDALVNTTILTDIQRVADSSILLLNITQKQLASSDVLSSQSNGRKLQQVDCANINWATVTTAQLQSCDSSQVSNGLNDQQQSLQDSQSALAMQTYNRLCKPYIRTSYSNDLKKNFNDDKTMKTCNDFLGCRECMEGRSNGKLVTQEDCNSLIGNDKQQWKLPSVGDKYYQLRNDEHKNCLQAPSNSSSSKFFTSEACDSTVKLQQFEVLEMTISYGDPRLVLRLAGTGSSTSPGLCMTTERADDDDGIRFIPAYCTCSYSQLMERDD